MSADEVENLIRGFYAYVLWYCVSYAKLTDFCSESDGKVVPVAERVQNNLLIQAGWSR